MFGIVDNIVVAIFVAIIVYVALKFSKTVTDMESYYLGNRSLPWALTVGTLVVTWYGGVGTFGIVEYGALWGLSIWGGWSLPAHLSRMPLALWIGPRARVRTDITVADLLKKTYGKPVAIIGALFMVVYCMQFGNITASGFIGKVTWDLPYLATGIIIVALVIFITVFAGLMGVAATDMLMFFCLGIAVVLVLPISWGDIGGWDGVIANLGADNELLQPFSGIGPLQMCTYVIIGLGVYADPSFYQRFSASDSPATGRRSLLWCLIIWGLFDVVLLCTGLVVEAMYPEIAPGEAYVTLVLSTLPVGVRAIFIVGMVGSAVSALDSYFLSGAMCFAYDFIGNIKSGIKEKTMLRITQWSVVGISLIGLWASFQFETAMDAFVTISGFWMAAGFTPVVAALLYKGKLTMWGGMLSMLSGGIAYLYFSFAGVVDQPLPPSFIISIIFFFIGNFIGKDSRNDDQPVLNEQVTGNEIKEEEV